MIACTYFSMQNKYQIEPYKSGPSRWRWFEGGSGGHPIDKGRFCRALLSLVTFKKILSTVIEMQGNLTLQMQIKDAIIRF